MKIITTIILSIFICITVFAQNESDFIIDKNGTITKYSVGKGNGNWLADDILH